MVAKVSNRSSLNGVGGMAPTNGALETITAAMPYTAEIKIRGTADMLFHRWNVESIDEKAAAPKGSKAKKTDDVESYVYRCDNGNIGLPGEYLRQSIIHAAKFLQDPRSPRKSAMDLYKAGLVVLTPLADLGIADWDYLHRCRVQVQRNGITRSRPAVKSGWEAAFEIMVQTPEYIAAHTLNEVIGNAGRLVGLADFRPTYGRFQVVGFEVQKR